MKLIQDVAMRDLLHLDSGRVRQETCPARTSRRKAVLSPHRRSDTSLHLSHYHECSYSFTLIEILVVAAIIAVLTAMLLPALSEARESAQRVKCLSNQKQMAVAMVAYAGEYNDHFPPGSDGMNASYTFQVATRGEWDCLGHLIETGFITDPELLYCPSQREKWFTYPYGWEETSYGTYYRFCGYLYRFFGEYKSEYQYITPAEIQWLQTVQYGALEYPIAVSSDIFIPDYGGWGFDSWPHLNPYGVSVAYSDGHAEFIDVGHTEYLRAGSLPYSLIHYDDFAFLFFKALDQRDFSTLAEAFPLP